jgi:hypothetical protein
MRHWPGVAVRRRNPPRPYRELTPEERADAIAEIRAVTTRADLLAEQAGVLPGIAPSRLIPQVIERCQQMGEVLIDAGADRSLIEQWRQVGETRA